LAWPRFETIGQIIARLSLEEEDGECLGVCEVGGHIYRNVLTKPKKKAIISMTI
jgi:hypothetical protein